MLLPEHLTVLEITRHKAVLEAAVAEQPQLTLEISPVQRVDTAGLQLLLAVKAAAQAQGGQVIWQGESTALSDAAARLGVARLLGL